MEKFFWPMRIERYEELVGAAAWSRIGEAEGREEGARHAVRAGRRGDAKGRAQPSQP